MTARRSTQEHGETTNGELGTRAVRGGELRASNGARAAVDRLRVILADPDPLARRAIRDSLRAEGGFLVAAEARDGLEAVELAVHYRPDVVLMEVALPGVDGISACRDITTRAPTVRVVMFSVPQHRDVELRALRAGASGFLSKNSSIQSLARALRSVTEGEAAVTRSLTSHLVDLLRSTAENGTGMRPVKSPLTTREISAKLFLSEDTVYSHTKSILRKLGVHSRTDAVAMAAQMRRPQLG
jgi:DNA-binding NarL/FixJ family response regulator